MTINVDGSIFCTKTFFGLQAACSAIGALLARCCWVALWWAADFFSIWQCLTWLESEMYFSMKAVSDFALENIARPTTDSALWLRIWESPSLLYSIWNLSKFDFWEEQSFSFFQTITKIWIFLIFECFPQVGDGKIANLLKKIAICKCEKFFAIISYGKHFAKKTHHIRSSDADPYKYALPS